MHHIRTINSIFNTVSQLFPQRLHCLERCGLGGLELHGGISKRLLTQSIKHFSNELTALGQKLDRRYIDLLRSRLHSDGNGCLIA